MRRAATSSNASRLGPGPVRRGGGEGPPATSERHEKASHFIERILARPGADAAVRCECALIQSGAAVYADDPDRFAELHDPCAKDPPLTDLLLLQVHANRSAFRTLLE